ncbi:MAG: M23 family metallopeptidase [Candidatus Pacebacteria bacterium]|nr:M23 family metallopeptidase [Candidatus Paceibacterota bacterium]
MIKTLNRKYFLALTFIVAGIIIFPCFVANADNQPIIPDAFVSSERLSQGDTLLIVVKNEPNQISGNLGLVPLIFFRDETGKDWIAITGITLSKTPGMYNLFINVPGKSVFNKNIIILKKDFPITQLLVTQKLVQIGYTAKNVVNNVINNENKILLKVLNVITPISYINKSFIYPVTEIKDVGAFGNIRKSNTYEIRHLGVDLKAPVNTLVYAANDGKVVLVESMWDYGNTVIVDHGLGVYSLYLHLGYFNVKEGQIVKQGDLIGLSGNTGYSITPHLHFSISMRGASLDPLKFIEATQADW